MSTPNLSKLPKVEEFPTFWDFLIALTDLEEYVGRYNPTTKELEIRHRADINPNDRVIEPRNGKARKEPT